MNNPKATSSPKNAILIVDDSITDVEYITLMLRNMGKLDFDYQQVFVPETLQTALSERTWDLILCDYIMPMLTPAQVIEEVKTAQPQTPLILMSGIVTVDQAVDMMRLGARAFIEKQNHNRLIEIVQQELETNRLRRQTQELQATLQAHDSRYQSIVDHQTELICRYNRDFKLTFVNRAYCAWHGKTREELLGESFIHTIPDDERPQAMAHVHNLSPLNPINTTVHQAILADGSVHIVEWTDQAIFDANGTLVEYQGVGRDITEREQQDKHLAEIRTELEWSQHELHSILNTMQDAIISISLHNRKVIYASSSVEAIFGYPLTDIMGSPDFYQKIVHPDDLALATQAMHTCLTQGFVELDHRVIHPNGAIRWIHRRAWVNFDENGHPLRVNDTAQDITSRKEAEIALSESEELHRVTLSNISDAVFITDDDGKFTFICPNVSILFGYQPEEIASMGNISALLGDNLFSVADLRQQQEITDIERHITNKMGQERDLLISVKHVAIQAGTVLYACRDFTHQKQANEALKLSEKRLSHAQRIAHLGNWDWNIVTNDLHWSDEIYRIFGLGVQEFGATYDAFLASVHPDDRQTVQDAVQSALRDNTPYSVEHRVVRPNGEILIVHEQGEITRDTNNTPIRMIGTVQDITERKQGESAIRQSEAYLRSLVNSQTAFHIRTDLNGTITYCNERYQSIFEQSTPHLIGTPALHNVHPDDHQTLIDIISLCLEHPNTPYQAELRKIMPESNPFWSLWEFIAISNEKGVVDEIQCMGFDISKQKQAEIALQEINADLEQRVAQRTAELEHNTKQLSVIFDHSGDGIVLLDHQFRIQQANFVFNELFGVNQDTYVETPLTSLFRLNETADLQAHLEQIVQTHESVRIEAQAQRLDNTLLDVEMSLSPVNRSDSVIQNIVCIIRDVTERKKATEILRHQHDELDRFFTVALDLLCIADTNGYFVKINKAWEDVLGYSAQTLEGQRFLDFVHPDDIAPTLEAIAHLNEQNPIMNFVNRYRKQDGTYRVIEWRSVPVGKLIYAAARDITERNKAEQALRLSEERYRKTLAAMSEGVVVQEQDGTITLCNTAAQRILGLTANQMMGRSSIDPRWQAVHEDGSPFPGETHPAMITLKTGEPQSNVMMGIHQPNGSLHWILIDSEPLIDPNQQQILAVVTTFTDITERKKSEEALRASEERLRILFETSPDTICLVNLKGIILDVNHAGEDLIGKSRDQIIGKSVTDLGLFSKPLYANYAREGLQTTARGDTRRMEYEILRTNGETAVIESITHPIHLNGELLQLAVIRDITTRRKAEKDLRESESRYRLLAENITDIIVKYDSEGICTYVTSSIANLGYTQNDLMGHMLSDFIHPDDTLELAQVAMQTILSGGTNFTVTHRTRDKSGNYQWAESSNTLVRHAETGELLEGIAVFRNIAERHAAEEALRASEEKFRLFVESAPIATIITNQMGKIVFVNQVGEKLFGYASSELMNEPIELLVPDHLRETHVIQREAFMEINNSYRAHPLELTGKHKNGSIFPAEVQLSRIIAPEGDMVMSYILDITQRQQAQIALKQALQHEKELGELKSRFVSMASHEFRTPLAAILATTETLTVYRDRMDNTQVDSRLDKIRQQVNHMKNIVEDVLQLARIQAGRVEFKPTLADLEALCRDIVEELSGQDLYLNRIVYESTNQPLYTAFDNRLMRQLISNLISNALKYSDETTVVTVSLTQENDRAIFTIQDQGIGIPEDDMKHLFEPFHRAKNVGTISGTGLGLSIAKQSVELHQGTILVSSKLGVGTTFTIELPITTAPHSVS